MEKRFWVIGSLLLCSWLASRPHQGPPPGQVRADLVAQLGRDQKLYQACLDNLKNHLTPGYKANDIFTSPEGRIRIIMSAGQIRETRNSYDLTIDGEGFFELADGRLTRDGRFQVRNGLLCSDGSAILGLDGKPIRLPADGTNLEMKGDGQVCVTLLNGDGRPLDCGQIILAKVSQPQWLERAGSGFRTTADSGPVQLRETPGKNGMGVVAQGYLEMANFNLLEQQETARSLREYCGFVGLPLREL